MSNKLDIYQFGTRLIETNDLDPVYVLLHHSGFSPNKLRHWLLAYWCFYHVGTASWISDSIDQYWVRMKTAAGSKDYLRSPERRHFRGQNAVKSVSYLERKGINLLFAPFDDPPRDWDPAEASDVVRYVQQWVGFGPWISFKVADMLERLNILKVKFDLDTVLYDSPREGAELLWRTERPGRSLLGDNEGEWAVNRILSEIDLTAPPRHERQINAQEAETILCKWKSYMSGHYEVGEDISACRNGLLRFAKIRTSQTLLKAGRTGGLW